ncbi:hypothetical protein NP233_g1448 [Leucocoprinus birnbaumii]|uniref:AAA protein C-terminal winged helix domain-containing protein n=1 Tax=Leucocoprinus birnbaumii TaxID=56174 RepID=A0AAD5W0J9_9AGAR|nr:hypothetical protein NP233_g1448 [Leucocoprinus birnbaumii]
MHLTPVDPESTKLAEVWGQGGKVVLEGEVDADEKEIQAMPDHAILAQGHDWAMVEYDSENEMRGRGGEESNEENATAGAAVMNDEEQAYADGREYPQAVPASVMGVVVVEMRTFIGMIKSFQNVIQLRTESPVADERIAEAINQYEYFKGCYYKTKALRLRVQSTLAEEIDPESIKEDLAAILPQGSGWACPGTHFEHFEEIARVDIERGHLDKLGSWPSSNQEEYKSDRASVHPGWRRNDTNICLIIAKKPSIASCQSLQAHLIRRGRFDQVFSIDSGRARRGVVRGTQWHVEKLLCLRAKASISDTRPNSTTRYFPLPPYPVFFMASLRRLVLPAAGRRAHVISLRYLPKTSYPTRPLLTIRSVHTPANNSEPTPPKPKPKPLPPHHTSQHPTPRHEVHERSEYLSVPGFNTPGGGGGSGPGGSSVFQLTRSPLFDAALTTVIGIGMVFVGGVAYVKWYKKNVLDKIEEAFAGGYDPALELAKPHTQRQPIEDSGLHEGHEFPGSGPWASDLRRKEQDLVDAIVHGKEPGHYFMLLGPKGSGKGTMIFQSMAEIQAEGVSFCDAHPDLEVFRLRLGKALNYEFHEDSQTGLFQRRDPREGGPGLDIERALNKLEKVALRACQKRGKPYVLIINNVHHFKHDEDGQAMLLQLQQRAESWAAGGILTMVFSSDDFWPYHFMRRTGSRMHTISMCDLNQTEAMCALRKFRMNVSRRPADSETLEDVVSKIGGRLSYLNQAARAKDMAQMANEMLKVEKEWLLSQIGLIADCDDDVMDEQKWSSCSWLLLQEFVKQQKEQEEEQERAIKAGELDPKNLPELPLPSVSYGQARQIMTRADFIEGLDHLNIIAIDINHDVRPDSKLILHAAREVCSQEGFDELLEGVRDRIDEIESLHRTRELTFKDLEKGDKVNLSVDKGGSVSSITSGGSRRFDEDDGDD